MVYIQFYFLYVATNIFTVDTKRQLEYTMRNLFVTFATAVCLFFLLILKWPKNKTIFFITVAFQ